MNDSPVYLPSNARFPWLGILLALASAWTWYQLVRARSSLIHPHCTTWETCSSALINGLDRWIVQTPHSPMLDSASFVTQYAAGALLFGAGLWAFAWNRSPITERLKALGLDSLWALQATLFNGALMEIVRNLVQRPRPFVYLNPPEEGLNPAHYISFYSGHTSFTVTACATAYLILRSRSPRQATSVRIALTLGILLSTATGAFRVLSGRHFPTDVLAAAAAGLAVAWATQKLQKKRRAEPARLPGSSHRGLF